MREGRDFALASGALCQGVWFSDSMEFATVFLQTLISEIVGLTQLVHGHHPHQVTHCRILGG